LEKEESYEIQRFFDENKKMVRELLPLDYDVELTLDVKNNNHEKDAMIIWKSKEKMIPTIYMSHFYKEYCNGVSIEKIVKEIVNISRKSEGKNELILTYITDFERISGRITYQLINLAMNKER